MSSTPILEKADDRHLLGVDVEQRKRFLAGHVIIRSSGEPAASFNGQLILWWLANLLSRQFRVVRRIEFDVPSVPMRPGIALFGHQAGLRETLVGTAAMIAGEKIVTSAEATSDADLILHVAPRLVSAAERDYVIWGDGWRCAAARSIDLPVGFGRNAIGPMLAATLGAAEAFQRITDWRSEGRVERAPLYLSAWNGKCGASWGDLYDGPIVGELPIEPFYLCGAGAVGQALAATLAYIPGRSGHAVILDGDPLDDSNLNRYCLSHRQSPPSKPDACKTVLESERFLVDAQPYYWDKYTALPAPRTRSSVLNDLEGQHRYRLIMSCVDKNPARHSLQNMWPRLMFGGSTSGLSIKVSRYDCATGECLKCAHPLPSDPTIEEEARNLRSMSEDEREKALSVLSFEKADAVRAYLADPGCGHAAESFLTELGAIRRREFSVGFVSVASGIFLAVGLIQHAMRAGDLVDGETNHFSFSFLNRKPGRHFFGRESNCGCAGAEGAFFRRHWSLSETARPEGF